MSIDLRTCQVGQKVERGDGTIVEYQRQHKGNGVYPHKVGGEWYTDDGCFMKNSLDTQLDIVRILPLESAKANKHSCMGELSMDYGPGAD